MLNLDLDFNVDPLDAIRINVDSKEVNLDFGEIQTISDADHNKLFNRDMPNQHPTSAIENLDNELDKKLSKSDMVEMPNVDIEEMFRNIFDN